MKNILRFGINGNMLKTIALIAMVIDHIGFYLEPFLNPMLMIVFRYIGRIAMPIFTYLVVQGFFHTKDFKKYVLRMGIWAVITQVVTIGLMVINLTWVQEYVTAKHSYETLNILFMYVIALIMMKIIHNDLLVKKWDYNKNISLKVVCTILIFIVCILLPADYNIAVPVLSLLLYFIEKIKIKFLINTEYIRKNINKIIKVNEQVIIQGICVFLIFMSLILLTVYLDLKIYTIFAIIPIALYNGERGKKSKILKNIFYFAFPMHHVLLYSLAMLITLT